MIPHDSSSRVTSSRYTARPRVLGRGHRASAWWIGDWLNYGEKQWGEKYDAAAVEITGLKSKTLREYSYVARTYSSSIRIEDLSFKHHQVVAGRLDEERTSLLEAASENNWSTRDLQARVSNPQGLRKFDPQNQRQHLLANAAARKLNLALGGIHGFCLGLADFKLERAIAGAATGFRYSPRSVS